MIRPVLTDAQLFGMFMAAADRLQQLKQGGLVGELQEMQRAGASRDDVQEILDVYAEMQTGYNKMREYFINHPDWGWEDDGQELQESKIVFDLL